MKKIFTFITFIFSILILSSCGEKIYECTPIAVFDTVVNMVFYDEDNYKEYYNDIKTKFNEINRATNDFHETSDPNSVYELNTNREVKSSLLADMLKKAIDLKDITNGYFNPFIGRLSHIWKKVLEGEAIPSDDEIANEISIMNETSIQIDNDDIKLNGSGNVDLGAFTKGYALEWAKNYLEEKGVSKYYISCGSSSIYIGDKELNVGISHPFKNKYIETFDLKNIGIATSSPKYQNIEVEGNLIHHLINPFTGKPSNIYDSVNVIGNNNLNNDVYSTAIFSMDLDTAKSFAEKENINIILFKNDEIIYQKESL